MQNRGKIVPDGGQQYTDPTDDLSLCVKALENFLVERGLFDPAALDILIETYEKKWASEWRKDCRAGMDR